MKIKIFFDCNLRFKFDFRLIKFFFFFFFFFKKKETSEEIDSVFKEI
jgi:hypothetical protein